MSASRQTATSSTSSRPMRYGSSFATGSDFWECAHPMIVIANTAIPRLTLLIDPTSSSAHERFACGALSSACATAGRDAKPPEFEGVESDQGSTALSAQEKSSYW